MIKPQKERTPNIITQNIKGKSEATVPTLNITDGMIIKGTFRTPITNIRYIEEFP